jgi:streptogramin lyase
MIGASGQVTLYTLPAGVDAGEITRGPNDTLWFTGYDGGTQVGSITADGTLTLYTINGISKVGSITTGPDSALWFVYFNNSTKLKGVARITTDGSVTFYPAT